MKFEKMSEEEALEKLRSEKNQPNTPSEFFYYVYGNAQPGFREVMEKYAASILAAGRNIGRAMAAAEKNPEEKEKFIRKLQELSQKMGTNNPKSKTGPGEKK